MSTQPSWHCVANNGDASPLEHGGEFVMVDRRGNYEAELWIWDPDKLTMATVVLERCFPVFRKGQDPPYFDKSALGTNRFHPHKPEWFGDVENLESVAGYIGSRFDDLVGALGSNSPIHRAHGYKALVSYHGIENFDSYPGPHDEEYAKRLLEELTDQIERASRWDDGFHVSAPFGVS